jgi:hypothetical protein
MPYSLWKIAKVLFTLGRRESALVKVHDDHLMTKDISDHLQNKELSQHNVRAGGALEKHPKGFDSYHKGEYSAQKAVINL